MKKFIIFIVIIIAVIIGFIMLSSDEQSRYDSTKAIDEDQEIIPRNDTVDNIVSDLDKIDVTDIGEEIDTEFDSIEKELQAL